MTLSEHRSGKEEEENYQDMWHKHSEEDAEILAVVNEGGSSGRMRRETPLKKPSKKIGKSFSRLHPSTNVRDHSPAPRKEKVLNGDVLERVDEASERGSRSEPQDETGDTNSESDDINFSRRNVTESNTNGTEESKVLERNFARCTRRKGNQESKSRGRRAQKCSQKRQESVADDGSLTFVNTLHMMFSDDESILLAERDGWLSAYDRFFACLFGFDVDAEDHEENFESARDLSSEFGKTSNDFDELKIVEPKSLIL